MPVTFYFQAHLRKTQSLTWQLTCSLGHSDQSSSQVVHHYRPSQSCEGIVRSSPARSCLRRARSNLACLTRSDENSIALRLSCLSLQQPKAAWTIFTILPTLIGWRAASLSYRCWRSHCLVSMVAKARLTCAHSCHSCPWSPYVTAMALASCPKAFNFEC